MIDLRLDRKVEFDVRSRRFTAREMLNALDPAKCNRGRAWWPGPVLDQGREGACVGFGIAHRLNGRPTQRNLSNDDARAIYHKALTLDQWPGEQDSGTSVLAGMKAAQELGYISSYYWIGAGSQTPIDDAVESVLDVGPVVLGIPWLDSMHHPRPSGLLNCSGRTVGGHCILMVGVRRKFRELTGEPLIEVAVLQNSWGSGYGVGLYSQQGGFVFMQLSDLENLLHMQGEGCVPVEVEP